MSKNYYGTCSVCGKPKYENRITTDGDICGCKSIPNKLKTKYKYIHFVEATGDNKTVNGKPAYQCKNNRTKSELAIILWYSPWKEYCFTQSAQGVIFNNSCLADVQHFIEQLNASPNN